VFWDDEGFSVGDFQEGVCGFGVLACEAFGFWVESELGAEDEGGFLEVYFVAVELFEHILIGVQGVAVVFHVMVKLVDGSVVAGAKSDVG